MTGFIYCITNDVNGKQYVGKTTNTIEKRFEEHIKDSTRSRCEKRPLYDAMNKYGIEHFSVSQLEECDLSILEEREKYWINELNTFHNGYNATHGGDGKQLYDYNLFIDDFLSGMGILAIARKYHCAKETVQTAIRQSKLNTNQNNEYKAKSVAQIDINTNEVIQIFPSVSAAAKAIKGDHSNISKACKNFNRTSSGYKWKYYIEE